MNEQAMVAIIAILVLAVIGLVAYIYLQKRRSDQLRSRFGPEYDRAIHEHGDRSKAERELQARKERVTQLHIVPLSHDDARRFEDEWRQVQGRFVDDPRRAVEDADRLVQELMQKRGYPMADFETRAADISVDHPKVVENYRIGHWVALENKRGTASTEDLRRALVHYRSLFDELLEVEQPEPVGVRK